MSSSHAGPSTVQERRPLLASTDSPSNDTGDRTEGTSQEDEAAQGSVTIYRSLSRVDKFLSRLFIAVIVTGVIQLGITLASVILSQYGSSRFGAWDYILSFAVAPCFWAALFGIVVALYNILLLRRYGRPAHLLIDILVFGVGGIILLGVAVNGMIEETSGYDAPHCRHDLDDEYDSFPGSYSDCLDWHVSYTVVVWIFLVVSFILGLEYLILFVGFFVKLYTERTTSQGGSTSTWNIPAGFLSFEVRVKWGAPQSAGQTSEGNASAAIPTAQGRRDEESGRPA